MAPRYVVVVEGGDASKAFKRRKPAARHAAKAARAGKPATVQPGSVPMRWPCVIPLQ